MKMILIPPGEFLMGSTDEQVQAGLKMVQATNAKNTSDEDRVRHAEQPQHRVTIASPFLIGASEVTVGQFRKFVAASKYVTQAETFGFSNSAAEVMDGTVKEAYRGMNWRAPGYDTSDELPVTHVSWNDTIAYCQWLSSQEKATYRLATEAEWEFACRAGTTAQYSFGDDSRLLERFAWYSDNSENSVHPVGSKLANPFGLHDMHGNLIEWCQDYYEPNWYKQTSSDNPGGPDAGLMHVQRGGMFTAGDFASRSACRYGIIHTMRSKSCGFRVVRVLDGLPIESAAPAPTGQ